MSITLNSYGVADGVLTVDSSVVCPDASWLLSFIYVTCDASEDYADNAVVKEFFSVDGTGRVNNNAQMHMLSARRISSIPLAIWPNGSLTFTVKAMYFDATPAPHYEYETGPSFTITNTDYIAPSVSPLSPFQEGVISKPITLTFDVPTTTDAAEIPVTVAAVDDNAVTAYLVNESPTPPLATAPGWNAAAPTSYTVSAPGAHTLYAWAKDADGNVSDAVSAMVTASFTPTTTSGTFDVPSITLQPTVVAPPLTGVQQGSFATPSVSLRPVVSAPTVTGVQQGSFATPSVSLRPDVEPPTLQISGVGISSGTFTLPALSLRPMVSPPSLLGMTGGSSIRAPSGQMLNLRRIDGSPLTILSI